jgi:hypothetical protein
MLLRECKHAVGRGRLTGYGSSLQAKQLELERQQHSDSLRRQLEKRPEREELIERMTCPLLPFIQADKNLLGNILPDSSAAPGIQANQRALDKQMRADSLDQKIQHRPKPEDLIKEGILGKDEDPTSPTK